MKLKEIKKLLNKLTPQQLEEEMLYNSPDLSISGVVTKVSKAKQNLYYTGEDDPAKLYTKFELRDMGMDKEEIEECGIEIPKGAIVIEF